MSKKTERMKEERRTINSFYNSKMANMKISSEKNEDEIDKDDEYNWETVLNNKKEWELFD